jgi:hypothetical protein
MVALVAVFVFAQSEGYFHAEGVELSPAHSYAKASSHFQAKPIWIPLCLCAIAAMQLSGPHTGLPLRPKHDRALMHLQHAQSLPNQREKAKSLFKNR